VIATGASWTKQILGPGGYPVPGFDNQAVYTPEDVMGEVALKGPVVVYDFDHYYMGSCLSEVLSKKGVEVTLVTPASSASSWTFMNNELEEIRSRLVELGVRVFREHKVIEFADHEVHLSSVYDASDIETIPCEAIVIVGARTPNDALYRELVAMPDETVKAGIQSVRRVGDCLAPGAIVHAVYSGHEYARELDGEDVSKHPFKREQPVIAA
jgi:dimethylamine/trimethylamine dehydrogenase